MEPAAPPRASGAQLLWSSVSILSSWVVMKDAASSRKRSQRGYAQQRTAGALAGSGRCWRVGEVLEQSDEPALGAAVALDISLGLLDRTMSGKLLHVAQAAAGLEHQPSGVGHERSPPRMRGAACETEIAIEAAKPVDDAARPQRVTPFRTDHGSGSPVLLFQPHQCPDQLRVQRDRPAASLLCRGVVKLDV